MDVESLRRDEENERRRWKLDCFALVVSCILSLVFVLFMLMMVIANATYKRCEPLDCVVTVCPNITHNV